MSRAEERSQNAEAADAEKVNQVNRSIQSGSVEGVESLLFEVVRNCPEEYVYEYEKDGALCIKFWDQEEFLHFVFWQKNQGVERSVNWIPSAYPRAYYYLGFFNVKTGRPAEAITLLDRGQALEPTNPRFRLEKAQAFAKLGRFDDALECYQEIQSVNRYVSAHLLAVACRGRGFVLIEKGDLDGAEAELKESLKHEPENEGAFNELAYIANLRRGATPGGQSSWRSVAAPPSSMTCALCGNSVESGKAVEFEGRIVVVCERCLKRAAPWWQFWKKWS